jgi:7,8-dihydropterin-6-yl-methyl-4-(beta-D-ribofuranosyl)aminobenzene 5'-phosphate synthase
MKFTFMCEDQGKNSTYLLGESSLSVLLEIQGRRILFDTGGHTLAYNAKLLNVVLAETDLIVISHGHWDHTEGLRELAECPERIPVIIHPDCFRETYVVYDKYPRYIAFQPDRLVRIAIDGEERAAKYVGLPFRLHEMRRKFDVHLHRKPIRFAPSMVFLGSIPRRNNFEAQRQFTYEIADGELRRSSIPDDSAIVITTDKGLIVVTGCGHAGICNTVEYSMRVCRTNDVFAVVGGFHLLDVEPVVLDETIGYLKSRGVKVVYPCHCIDARALGRFIAEFNSLKVCAGDTVDWNAHGIKIVACTALPLDPALGALWGARRRERKSKRGVSKSRQGNDKKKRTRTP